MGVFMDFKRRCVVCNEILIFKGSTIDKNGHLLPLYDHKCPDMPDPPMPHLVPIDEGRGFGTKLRDAELLSNMES